MALQFFNPSVYTKQSLDLCEVLETEDKLEMKKLVEGFFGQIKDERSFVEGIVAVQSPSGSGKSFFLALLYCEILKGCTENNPVEYIDILDHIADDNAQEVVHAIEFYKDKESKTSVVLIDNLDKHTPKYIYEFIHLLYSLTGRENFLFILAYDYSLLLKKLSDYLADEEQEIEQYLQSHISLDFFIDTQGFNIKNILELAFIPNSYAKEYIESLLESSYRTNALSIKQIIIIVSKLKRYIEVNSNIQEIQEVYMVLKLLIYKLRCKKQYTDFYYGSSDNLSCKDSKLDTIFEAINTQIDEMNKTAQTEPITEKQIIRKMEISNVSQA